ncbi:MAG: chemotaxis protein CheX [Lachnospiraceae bacterium]|nr:chemotaxis protein CheX [Lachnospiraceae bacterium]
MFGVYFCNYLEEKGLLSKEQSAEVIDKCRKSKVKLGLLATELNFMTQEQANEVNKIQQKEDRRFGDIAIEKGYLSEGQLSLLLKQQGDGYLLFVQAVTEADLLDNDEIQKILGTYAIDKELSQEDVEAIKSGDIDREVQVFLNKSDLSQFYKEYVALTARFLVRFVDANVRIDVPVKVDNYTYKYKALQGFIGDKSFNTMFAGDDGALTDIAEAMLKEEMGEVDMDTLDAVCEFLNMNNGLFARDEYEKGISVDMLPPEMELESGEVNGNVYKIPFFVHGKELDLIISE